MVLHPLFDEKKTMSCQQEMCEKIQKNCQLCRKICIRKIQANSAQSILHSYYSVIQVDSEKGNIAKNNG